MNLGMISVGEAGRDKVSLCFALSMKHEGTAW